MVRIIAVLYGIAFVFIGVAGFFPEAMSESLLFGYFQVGYTLNIIHIITGVLAIMAATTYGSARTYFELFGIVYLIIGLIGFIRSGDVYFFTTNTADNVLYVILAVIALYLGFLTGRRA